MSALVELRPPTEALAIVKLGVGEEFASSGLGVGEEPASSRRRGEARTRRLSRCLVALVAFLLSLPGPAAAQGETTPADPFAGRPFLQARALRGFPARVAAEILQGDPGGEIALAVLPLPAVRRQGGEVEIRLFVEIDGATFLSHNPAEVARVEIYAYALRDRSVADYSAEAFAVAVGERGEAIWQSGLKYHGRLELPPGGYTLRVLVRNAASGARGLVELPLEVPVAPGESLLLPDPRGRDAWLPVRGWRLEGHPFTAGGQVVRPAARPVLLAGRTSELYLAMEEPSGAPAEARLEILAAQGEAAPVAEVPLAPGEPAPAPPPADGGPALVPFRFQVPELPAGDYRLRLAYTGPGGAALHSAPVEVMVAPAGPQERELLWTDLRWRLAGVAPALAGIPSARSGQEEVEARSRRGTRRRLRKLRQAYHQVLAQLAADPAAPAARTALLDLESTVLADARPERLADLQAAELAVGESLADGEAESLLPVLALHEELYRTYRNRRLFALSSHSLLLVEALAELYARQGGSPELAARALASLGGHLQEAELPAGSRRLFTRALEHDPDNPAALLGVAVSCEKYGEYPAAVGFLERLVESHPEVAEGRLRLAVNLQRTGERVRAGEALSRTLTGAGPEWVQLLAYEELARGRLAAGLLDEAEALLEAGLERFPGAAGLSFLLAHVQDRQGRYRPALARLDGVEPAAGSGPSPRKRYDTWPQGLLQEARQRLAAAAGAGLAPLARALEKTGS